MADALGIYLSIPFCKAKCSFCNFASGVFAAERMAGYIERLREEMGGTSEWADRLGIALPRRVDTVYFGGGTPSLLDDEAIEGIFAGLRGEFRIDADAEITVECAPQQLSDASLARFREHGVNRLSFGVQSFVDREAAAVGRLHTGAQCRAELRRVQEAGIERTGVDLIVGLPHQTEESWSYTVEQAIASGVEHVSVYMLEVDDGSRLGREALRGGKRFGAGQLPEDDRVADWYLAGCEWLAAAGLQQYEISNFARAGGASRHNRKYWERMPYVGFGLDAHSMLRQGVEGVRWANADEMDAYAGPGMGSRGFARTVDRVGRSAAFEEALFLGLRLAEGVDVGALRMQFGADLVAGMGSGVEDAVAAGLAQRRGERLWLTARGRMASNEVFSRLLVEQLV